PRDLHPFPTRRSSDLPSTIIEAVRDSPAHENGLFASANQIPKHPRTWIRKNRKNPPQTLHFLNKCSPNSRPVHFVPENVWPSRTPQRAANPSPIHHTSSSSQGRTTLRWP